MHSQKLKVAGSSTSLAAPLLLAAALLLSIFLLHARTYSAYTPFGDDPAVLGASAANPIDWFRFGFSRYFIVYPEWTVPFTDFLRPSVNAIVRFYEAAFGHHYAFYFAVFYVAQYLLVLFVLLIARQARVGAGIQLILSALLAINPAFVNLGIVDIADQFDCWCGLFAIAALFFVSRKQYLLSGIFLLIAVFTKEGALYAPVAAFITVWLTTRRKLLAASMLLPLLTWIGIRKFFFIGSVHGLYALRIDSSKAILLGIVRGVLQWPTGLVPDHGINTLLSKSDLLHKLPPLIFLIMNLLLWILLAGIGLQLLHKNRDLGANTGLLFTAYLWLCGALSFGVLVAPYPRFGGSIYPLELLLLAVAWASLPTSIWRDASRWALCLLLPMFLWNVYATRLDQDKLSMAQLSMRRLNEALMRNGTAASTVYILDSRPSFSAPEYLASYVGITARIVVLNEFDGCLSANDSQTSVAFRGPSEVDISVKAPLCARFVFSNVNPLLLAQSTLSQKLARGDFATYNLPLAHAVAGLKQAELDLGDRLNISLRNFDSESSVLLYYDWATSSYRCIGKRCDTSS